MIATVAHRPAFQLWLLQILAEQLLGIAAEQKMPFSQRVASSAKTAAYIRKRAGSTKDCRCA
jgi:hypothetical protein